MDERRQSEYMQEFIDRYWDDLSPEQISWLVQHKIEVAKIEQENALLAMTVMGKHPNIFDELKALKADRETLFNAMSRKVADAYDKNTN